MSRVHAGIDIGGTTTHVVLVDSSLAMLGARTVPTPSAIGGRAMMDAAESSLRTLLEEVGGTLGSIGVGVAGVVDAEAGIVTVASDSFRDWAGYPIVGHLEEAFGTPVTLLNDVNAFLLAEQLAPASGDSESAPAGFALGIALGTGVGGALWIDGELFGGATGAAGEIGHIPGFGDRPCTCGGVGHLETLASARSIVTLYREATGTDATVIEIAGFARQGDDAAVRVFTELGTALGHAVATATSLVDLEAVVIGGGVSNTWDLFARPMFDYLASEPLVGARTPRIWRTRLGDRSPAIGAAVAGRDAALIAVHE